jgi:hypothetical protein
MQLSNFNHVRLLRYAGLFTYLCVGTPLITNWAAERVSLLHRPNFALLLWTLCYLLFGLLYWAVTSNLGSRRYQGLRLLGLVAMSMFAMAVGWYSHSGLSAMLMAISAVALPWLLPVWLGVPCIVLQNLSLVVVFVNFPEYDHSVSLAFLQTSIYLGISALMYVASMAASQQAEQREAQRRLTSDLPATRALLA